MKTILIISIFIFSLAFAQENLSSKNVSIDINRTTILSMHGREISISVGIDDFDPLYLEGNIIASDSEFSSIELSQRSINTYSVLKDDVIVKVKTNDLYFKLSENHKYYNDKFLAGSNGADGLDISSYPDQYKIIGYNIKKDKYLFNMSFIEGFGEVDPLFSEEQLYRVYEQPRPLTHLTSLAKIYPRLVAHNGDKMVVAVTGLSKGFYRYEHHTMYYVWDFGNGKMTPEEFKPIIRRYGLYFTDEIKGKKIVHFNYRGDGYRGNSNVFSHELVKYSGENVYVKDINTKKILKINKKYIIKPNIKLACSKLFSLREFR